MPDDKTVCNTKKIRKGKLNHRFYSKNNNKKNRIAVAIATLSLTVICFSVVISVYSGIYLIGFLTFAITLSIAAPFFDIPSLKKSGRIIYYSSLFLTEKPKNGVVKIHGGTLFDYWFVIDRKMNGKQRTDFIIQQYLEGLLSLMEEHKHHKQMRVRGTSYIINERTAEKMGFEILETDLLQKAIITYNYFNILISNSIAKNKLAFPNLGKTKTFEAEIGRLVQRREYIERLHKSMKRSY